MAKCKYPNEVCANMTVYHGVAYCDSVPCSLKDELPKRTNYEKIKGMSVEELAEFIFSIEELSEGYSIAIGNSKEMCSTLDVKEWLESECDVEC